MVFLPIVARYAFNFGALISHLCRTGDISGNSCGFFIVYTYHILPLGSMCFDHACVFALICCLLLFYHINQYISTFQILSNKCQQLSEEHFFYCCYNSTLEWKDNHYKNYSGLNKCFL